MGVVERKRERESLGDRRLDGVVLVLVYGLMARARG